MWLHILDKKNFYVLGKWIGVNTNSLKRSDFTPLLLCIGQRMLFFGYCYFLLLYRLMKLEKCYPWIVLSDTIEKNVRIFEQNLIQMKTIQ